MKWLIALLLLLQMTYYYNGDGSYGGHSYDTGTIEYNYDASGQYDGYSYEY
tara:strand:- start:4 stop:156 length:153 start_codon:yes stop_codon:yes gene_type:complete